MNKFKFLFITGDPEMARYAADAGVGRLFVDLEIRGKEARQGHLSTVISRHQMEDVSVIRESVPDRELLVRLNPWHAGSKAEIDEALGRGADYLMLPMFSDVNEVRAFCDHVAGRAGVIPLVETPGAMDSLEQTVHAEGVTEIYLGLNDLHLAHRMTFMFQLLVDGTVDRFADVAREAGLPFGFGGVARAGEGLLSAELIMKEHARVGSTRVILSRTFHRQASSVAEMRENVDFRHEIALLQNAFEEGLAADSATLECNHQRVRELVDQVVA